MAKMPKVDFSSWNWGEPDGKTLLSLWKEANENGAQVAIEQMAQEEAFVTMDLAEDGDISVWITIGPLQLVFNKSDLSDLSGHLVGHFEVTIDENGNWG